MGRASDQIERRPADEKEDHGKSEELPGLFLGGFDLPLFLLVVDDLGVFEERSLSVDDSRSGGPGLPPTITVSANSNVRIIW